MRALRLSAGKAVFLALFTVALLWTLFPIYWMLVTAVRPSAELFQRPLQLWPDTLTFSNFTSLVTGSSPIVRYFTNSVVTSVATAVLTLVVSVPAAFAFSRLRFRFKGALYVGILLAQMLPLVVLLLPLYILFLRAELLDTYLGLVLGYCSFAIPFAVWLLKSFIDSVPRELEEASLVDGCTRFGAMWRIVVPAILPAMVATGAFAFVDAWNNLLFPLALTTSIEMKTLPPGMLLAFAGDFKHDWGGMMATNFITAVPVIAVFVVFQRYLVDGLTEGAVKG
ncbi:carbohydrate ABC transporter permease [soil metagenome]